MITITGKPISIDTVNDVAINNQRVQLSKQSREVVKDMRRCVDEIVAEKKIAYGITTGFGGLKNVRISEHDVKKLQHNLILSHAVGVGEPLSTEVTRGIIFLIANYLAKGASGVRPIVIETLIELLNKNVTPVVPEKGSVGSSGDLAPSAHIVLVLIGHGEAVYKGTRMSGKKALDLAGIKALELEAKEGLGLINNTATMSSVACHVLYNAYALSKLCDMAGALSAEALRATPAAFDKRIHALKPHSGQIETADYLRAALKGSTMLDTTKVQDQYSIRCMPQIHGAIKEAIRFASSIVSTEINSVTDNPLIFRSGNHTDVISGGNFHGEPVAIAMDALGLAVCELGNIADRRIASLLDPATNNGLPPFLAVEGGLNSGFMILQYTTAALVSENKVLAHPASVDSIPTSANVEDLVSMGTIAARKALSILDNISYILTIELLAACQAIDFRMQKGFELGRGTKKTYNKVRQLIPFFTEDSEYRLYIDTLHAEIFSIIN